MRPHFPTPSLCRTALKSRRMRRRRIKNEKKETQTKEIGNTRQSIDHTKS